MEKRQIGDGPSPSDFRLFFFKFHVLFGTHRMPGLDCVSQLFNFCFVVSKRNQQESRRHFGGGPPKNKKQQPTFGHCFEQCRAPVRWLRCYNQKSWFLFPKAGSEDPGEHPKIGAFGLDFGPASSRTGAGVGLGWIGHKGAY